MISHKSVILFILKKMKDKDSDGEYIRPIRTMISARFDEKINRSRLFR